MNATNPKKSYRAEYPSEYAIRQHPDKQIAVWAEYLPKLDAGEINRALPYPIRRGMEDCFIIPKPLEFASSLSEATEFMLGLLGIDTRNIPFKKLKQKERTESTLSVLSSFQKGHFWLIPAQLGFYRRGEGKKTEGSYRENEFGFDLYLAAAALVSHPGRLTGEQNELGLDCPGNDDFLVNAGFPRVPCFESYAKGRECFLRPAYPNPRFGSATGIIQVS